jgi:CRISPR/Cas system-associated exonuclease Cas4 (RecB family)
MGMLSSNHPGTMRKLRLTVPVTFADYMLPYFEHFMAEKWYLRRMEPEKEFKIPLGEIAQSLPQDKLHPLYETYKHIEVQGKMDLVLYPDTIIDFKTQASAPGPATLVKNFQTNLYTLIFDKDMTFLYVYLFRRLRIKELKILGADRIDKFNALVDFINIVATAKSYNRNPKSCYMCVFRKFCKIV